MRRTGRSVSLVQLQRGYCGNLHILQSGPSSAKCAVLIQHGRNVGSTQLSPKSDPFALRATGPSWAPYGLSTGNIAGPFGPDLDPPPHSFTPDQVAHVEPNLRPNAPRLRHVGPQLGSTWGQLARVRRKLGPSWASCSTQLKAKDGQVWPRSAFGWAK